MGEPKVDARGLSCPQPVLLARAAIKKGEFPIEVWVDTATALENVRRVVEINHCRVEVEETGEEFHLKIWKS